MGSEKVDPGGRLCEGDGGSPVLWRKKLAPRRRAGGLRPTSQIPLPSSLAAVPGPLPHHRQGPAGGCSFPLAKRMEHLSLEGHRLAIADRALRLAKGRTGQCRVHRRPPGPHGPLLLRAPSKHPGAACQRDMQNNGNAVRRVAKRTPAARPLRPNPSTLPTWPPERFTFLGVRFSGMARNSGSDWSGLGGGRAPDFGGGGPRSGTGRTWSDVDQGRPTSRPQSSSFDRPCHTMWTARTTSTNTPFRRLRRKSMRKKVLPLAGTTSSSAEDEAARSKVRLRGRGPLLAARPAETTTRKTAVDAARADQ